MPRMFRRNLLYVDDIVRTSGLPAWRCFARYLRSFASTDSEKRLRAATSYLMHRPAGIFSNAAIRQAYKSGARVAQARSRMNETSIIRSAVIKSSRSTFEPGVILVSFEKELQQILSLRRYADLQKHYRICFMPTWQNFFSPEVIELDVQATTPYYLLPSCFAESSLRHLLGIHCRFLPFHAASWVNHRLYCVSPVEKDIDIVMLANFSRFKRHWKLFEALKSLPKEVRAILIGVPLDGRDRNSLLKEASLFNVADRLTIIENPRQSHLRNLLERAKIMCALSHREGSYVGVAEALMANTPVAMYANAIIGTKAYINDDTGYLLDPHRKLAEQLAIALAKAERLQPRSWAIKTISAETNCHRLNSLLKEDYLANGNSWSEDIGEFYCVRFEIYYSTPGDLNADRFDDDYTRLKKDFGLTIERPAQILEID